MPSASTAMLSASSTIFPHENNSRCLVELIRGDTPLLTPVLPCRQKPMKPVQIAYNTFQLLQSILAPWWSGMDLLCSAVMMGKPPSPCELSWLRQPISLKRHHRLYVTPGFSQTTLDPTVLPVISAEIQQHLISFPSPGAPEALSSWASMCLFRDSGSQRGWRGGRCLTFFSHPPSNQHYCSTLPFAFREFLPGSYQKARCSQERAP